MAETEFIVSDDRMQRFIESQLSDYVIAQNHTLPTQSQPNGTLIEQLRGGTRQFFIKHSSFATVRFQFKPYSYDDGRTIFAVDQFAGIGHLKILSTPLTILKKPAYRLSIAYQSFFVSDAAHLSASSELKAFYSAVVRSAKKGTQRLEVWSGRCMWFETSLIDDDPAILEKVRASFQRADA